MAPGTKPATALKRGEHAVEQPDAADEVGAAAGRLAPPSQLIRVFDGHERAMKLYLDNNVVSAIAKRDIPAERHAIERLLEAERTGQIELCT